MLWTILLIIYLLGLAFFGYRLMGRLDRFLRDNRKKILTAKQEEEPLPCRLGCQFYLDKKTIDAGS